MPFPDHSHIREQVARQGIAEDALITELVIQFVDLQFTAITVDLPLPVPLLNRNLAYGADEFRAPFAVVRRVIERASGCGTRL